jgi:hypothetical protein
MDELLFSLPESKQNNIVSPPVDENSTQSLTESVITGMVIAASGTENLLYPFIVVLSVASLVLVIKG